MSPTLLSRRLKELEQAGIVCRASGSSRVSEYHLTEAGRELWPLIENLGVWGKRSIRAKIEKHRLDAGLLMWDIRRSLALDRLPRERTVMRRRGARPRDPAREQFPAGPRLPAPLSAEPAGGDRAPRSVSRQVLDQGLGAETDQDQTAGDVEPATEHFPEASARKQAESREHGGGEADRDDRRQQLGAEQR
jgi:DNA-binding MarR family transcriptional regulator